MCQLEWINWNFDPISGFPFSNKKIRYSLLSVNWWFCFLANKFYHRIVLFEGFIYLIFHILKNSSRSTFICCINSPHPNITNIFFKTFCSNIIFQCCAPFQILFYFLNSPISPLTFNYKLIGVIQNLIYRISHLKSFLELGFF